MSTTSVPFPFAAALSRADRSAPALVMSISSGAATTGTPPTTSTGNLSSGICAPPVAAGTAAVAAWLAQGRPASPGPGTGIPGGAGRGCGPLLPARAARSGHYQDPPPAAGCQHETRENFRAIHL